MGYIGDYLGGYYRVINGDIRSLDDIYSSFRAMGCNPHDGNPLTRTKPLSAGFISNVFNQNRELHVKPFHASHNPWRTDGSRDERFKRAQNIREDHVQKGLVVQLSLRQGIYDVLGFAEATSMSNVAKVAEAYQKVKLADSAERISDSFCGFGHDSSEGGAGCGKLPGAPYTIQETSQGISFTLNPKLYITPL